MAILYTIDTVSPGYHNDSVLAVFNSSGEGIFVFSSLFVSPVIPGYYILGISHRNHIRSWSSSYVYLGAGYDTASYNFTDARSKTFGENFGNAVQIGSRWCFYGGDVNQDYVVNITDEALVENASEIYTTGYVPTDCNGDGLVDLVDKIIADNNSYSFIYSIHP